MRKKIVAIILGAMALTTATVIFQPNHNPQLYPDLHYTTGVVATTKFQELTTTTSCGTYSACHRLTTNTMKTKVCTEYPDNCKVTHEIDHLIPLALGGADTIGNLWAQPEHVLVNGIDYGFHSKDKLETYLVIQMKTGKITPTDAQNCLLNDWIKCFNKYNPYGSITNVNDPDE